MLMGWKSKNKRMTFGYKKQEERQTKEKGRRGKIVERVIELHRTALLSAASVVGGEEKRGPFGKRFDFCDETGRFGEKTFEKAEGHMVGLALSLAMKKRGDGVLPQAVLAGDLQNQCMGTAEGLLPFGLPHLGLYGACSTATEGLLLASLLVEGGFLSRAAAVTSSHNAAAERQFRFPLEYGGQRTPTAQWTATAAAAFLVGEATEPAPLALVRAALVGRMVDGGVTDASNMGAAMAPGAADSLLRFFGATGTCPSDYDRIVTGDLGKEGSALLSLLMEREGMPLSRHEDCGVLLYDESRQDIHAGASGCGCSASLLAAHYLPLLQIGGLQKILFLSTGAIMSPGSLMQGGGIYGVAPVLLLESPRTEARGKGTERKK